MSENLIGQILLNQFRVDAFIDSGGMGAVFRVYDLQRKVPLAMKVLHADLVDDPSMFKRFQREANALKRLAHPNIVPFYGLHQAEDMLFILEAYIDGPNLKKELRRRAGQPFDLKESIIYLRALCAALGYAHSNGVVHCDVKPGNTLVDSSGNIYLTDFGIARHAESSVTTFMGAGTLAYMAPEQIRDQPVTPATDVYALGITLYEMLTGQRPFRVGKDSSSSGATAAEQLRLAHLEQPPPDPRRANPAVPDDLARVICQAMAKDPAQRFADVQTFYQAVCTTAGFSAEQIPTRLPVAMPTQPAPSWQPPIVKQQARSAPLGWRLGTWMLLGAVAVSAACLVMSMFLRPTIPISPAPQPWTQPALETQTPVALIILQPTDTDQPTSQPSLSNTPYPSSTPYPTYTPEPTYRPEPTYTDWPTAAPPPPDTDTASLPPNTSCPGAVSSHLQIDMRAYVCTKTDRLIVRSEPNQNGNPLFRIYPNTRVKVIGGPVCWDGSNWWEIRIKSGVLAWNGSDFHLDNDQDAWVREGSDKVDPYYLCPDR